MLRPGSRGWRYSCRVLPYCQHRIRIIYAYKLYSGIYYWNWKTGEGYAVAYCVLHYIQGAASFDAKAYIRTVGNMVCFSCKPHSSKRIGICNVTYYKELLQEQNKQERKVRSREQKVAEEQRLFELKQMKKRSACIQFSLVCIRDACIVESDKHTHDT